MNSQTSPQIETERIVIPDTSLCAIVRDEMINPAQLPGKSGIRSFVESHVPYVEQAVIVDTGSIDGTRQELEQLASEFPNLTVHDRKFDNYVNARNHSLSLVPTKRALVLDVDELIPYQDLTRIQEQIERNSPRVLRFDIKNVNANGNVVGGGGHSYRLFDKNGAKFESKVNGNVEFLRLPEIGLLDREFCYREIQERQTGFVPTLLHFMPGELPLLATDRVLFQSNGMNYIDSKGIKHVMWYCKSDRFSESPSLREGFKYWKQPNPNREEHK